jgi:transcriptional regulator with XRE-family HTH domain
MTEELGVLARRIREQRDRVGMKQGELAATLGTEQETVSKWESGRMPKADKLPDIAAALGCSVGYLLGVEDQPLPPDPGAAARGYEIVAGVVHAMDADPGSVDRIWRWWTAFMQTGGEDTDGEQSDADSPDPSA